MPNIRMISRLLRFLPSAGLTQEGHRRADVPSAFAQALLRGNLLPLRRSPKADGTSALRALLASIILFLPFSHARAEEDKWLVASADMRLKMEIEKKPSVPEAGIVVFIQNGGLLPAPAALAVVFDSAGKELKNECIWNNPKEGFGLVFETPTAEGPVSIYFKKSSSVRAWTPKSPLRPSLLLYTETGKHNLNDARTMGSKEPPGSSGRAGLVPMVADRANRFATGDGYMSYYCGWLNVPEDGPIYYGTVSSDGSQAVLDGKVVAEWQGEHTYHETVPGEHGRTSVLGKGTHRFEYFHFTANPNPQTQFIWRLSGTQKDHADTPRNHDFVQSGSGKIVSAETRFGAPLAMFESPAIRYAGYDGALIDLFELTVPFSKSDSDVDATWDLGNKYGTKGTSVLWPVMRGDFPTVRLTLKNRLGTTSSSKTIYASAVPKFTDVTAPEDRALWQEALLNRLKASPRRNRPAEDWPKCFWTMLPEIIEPSEARDLLGELFERSFDDMQKLPPEAREKLEDIYLQDIAPDHEKAAAFLSKTISNQKDPGRRIHWQILQIDFTLFELGDLNAARKLSEQFRGAPNAMSPTDAALRTVQRGDIERLSDHLDLATQFYAAAQQEYRKATAAPTPPLGSSMDRPSPTPKPQAATPAAPGMALGAAKGTQTDWRVRTVRQNAFFSQVASLLDQGYIAEAKVALDTWLVEFPFSKLNGDYSLAEARYYSLLGNNARAVRILKAYRKQTEISNELPPAMEMELRCLVSLDRQDDIKELCNDITKRFPDLPLAKLAADALAGTPLPPSKMIRQKAVKKHKSP